MTSKTIITAVAVMLLALGIPSFFTTNEVQSANVGQQPGLFQLEQANQYAGYQNSPFPYQSGNYGSNAPIYPAGSGSSNYGYGQMGGMMGGMMNGMMGGPGMGQFGRGFSPMGGSLGGGMMGF